MLILYCADKESFNAINSSMTGDSYSATLQGPILNNLFNLLKGKSAPKLQSCWDSVFVTDNCDIVLLAKNLSIGHLSKFEIKTLDKLNNKFKKKDDVELLLYLWGNEKIENEKLKEGESIPITPKQILSDLGRSEKEIKIIEKENAAYEREERLLSLLKK